MKYLFYLLPGVLNIVTGLLFFITAKRMADAGVSSLAVTATLPMWALTYAVSSYIIGKYTTKRNAVKILFISQIILFVSLLGLLLAAFVVMRSWRQFRVREYLFIVFHVGLGIPLGIYLMEKLPKQQLIALLVLFMFIVGIRGLVSLWQARKNREELATGAPAKNLLMRLVLFFGGIIHGAFTTGGPFVIIYASRALPHKAEFRGTLSSLWLTTNIVMLIRWFTTGVIFESALLKTLLYALPFVIGGMFFGDYLHRRVNEYYFKVLVYSVLLVSAALLLCREIIFA